jgi:UDP-N-acetylmuramyl pentapeptide synthase
LSKKSKKSNAIIARTQQAKRQKEKLLKKSLPQNKVGYSALDEYPFISVSQLIQKARPRLEHHYKKVKNVYRQACLFVSISNGTSQASVYNFRGGIFNDIWEQVEAWAAQYEAFGEIKWLRAEWVDEVKEIFWKDFEDSLLKIKRNYFRYGLSLDSNFKQAFLEQELNSNAMLYLGAEKQHGGLNQKNFNAYARRKYGNSFDLDVDLHEPVWLFTTRGIFLQANKPAVDLNPFIGDLEGRDTGRRHIEVLDKEILQELIDKSSKFLASQVRDDGRFIYGLQPCFDREINTYNTLRHASTLYSMLEAWEITHNKYLKQAIDRSLDYLVNMLLRDYQISDGSVATFLIDLNDEIKLGGNAVCLLALVKHSELTGSKKYLPLMEKIANGISALQDKASGQFVHVLHASNLSIKERFRIIYYDGEAAFGLMRLYGLTKNPRWLEVVEKAFEYFIANNHWRAHDHWLGYCVNELTIYKPEARYYQFGIDNFASYLGFVEGRITTFPTLLELMMAAHKMIERLKLDPHNRHLLKQIDLIDFDRALNARAKYLLNGFFFPEVAMFFKNPSRILGGFFIRHHSFRVRIDDVEHYLSGYIAYLSHYLNKSRVTHSLAVDDSSLPSVTQNSLEAVDAPYPYEATVIWGGDVNLGRRQHYRTEQIGSKNVLDIPELRFADLSIVNLECVVATVGSQGVIKGEGGPYYYRARPEMVEVLTSAGIKAVAVANNHSGDYGNDALLQQKTILDAVGITSVGAGRNRADAFSPIYCSAGKLSVALFSVDATQHRFAATPSAAGTAYLPLHEQRTWYETYKPLVESAREKADVVLIAVHWGDNHAMAPSDNEILAGHALIEAGFDAVMGASAHCLQGVEIYKNKPIIHDAGDLLFDAVGSRLTPSGVFRLGLTESGVSWLEFLPVGVGFGFSRRLQGMEATSVVQTFVARSAKMGTSLEFTDDCAVIKFDKLPVMQSPGLNLSRASNKNFTQTSAEGSDTPSSSVTDTLHVFRRGPDDFAVSHVPEDARILPSALNGLNLLGVRTSPKSFDRRRMLWVETWWSCDQPVGENLRLSYLAVPKGHPDAVPWGRGMDHDPCDWMLPTGLWKPGQIYRDFYGIRPPQLKDIHNFPLQLEIRVVGKKPNSEAYLHREIFKVELQKKVEASSRSLDYRTDFPDLSEGFAPSQTWTATQIAHVTGGTWIVPPSKDWFVRSVVNGAKHIGMREQPILFVAHTNHERFFHEGSRQKVTQLGDRHPVIAQNIEKLAGAIVSKVPTGLPKDFPILKVADPIKAHIELGLAARQRYKGPVIAVTGTVGKSTTLNLLETLFEPGQALKSIDNYNSRVGVPVQLASLALDHKAALLEVAQSSLWMQRGPITRLIKPTISVLTEIGLSQTNTMVSSTEDVARWKSNIFDGLSGEGIAIFGDHLLHFDEIKKKALQHAKKVQTYGTRKDATLRIRSQASAGTSTNVSIELDGTPYDLNLPFSGQGMLNNAYAALLVANLLGYGPIDAAQRFRTYVPEDGRLVSYDVVQDGKTIRVLDDSWNAEVLSMQNAFEEMRIQAGERRKVAVLGRIVHLGSKAPELHASLAAPLQASGVSLVITHGEEMKYLRAALPTTLLGPHFENAYELFSESMPLLQDHDFVLIKGSRRDSDFGELSKLFQKN